MCVVAIDASRAHTLPGVYDVTRQAVTLGARSVHATYVKPLNPRHPRYFVVFATGDGGWRGTSSAVFEHLADDGYAVAGFRAPEIMKPVKESGQRIRIAEATADYAQLFANAKRDLGVPPDAALIVVGFSRGATVVAFTAVSRTLRQGLAGAIAIALTRESDYLKAPEPEDRLPEIRVDKKDRMQLYPALELIGSTPFAVIQSSNDRYVPAAESRELLGPDTPTLRLYEVPARNHRFGGGRAALLTDLDDALRWIENREP
jgi:fermentation-respiration switch protein FrsA (DUF1100 family)